ncbi:hypothetical protein RFI_03511, partial [Reticulomyxa filosa]
MHSNLRKRHYPYDDIAEEYAAYPLEPQSKRLRVYETSSRGALPQTNTVTTENASNHGYSDTYVSHGMPTGENVNAVYPVYSSQHAQLTSKSIEYRQLPHKSVVVSPRQGSIHGNNHVYIHYPSDDYQSRQIDHYEENVVRSDMRNYEERRALIEESRSREYTSGKDKEPIHHYPTNRPIDDLPQSYETQDNYKDKDHYYYQYRYPNENEYRNKYEDEYEDKLKVRHVQEKMRNEKFEYPADKDTLLLLNDVSRHPLYKTSYCVDFQRTGSCKFGARCKYAHFVDELRSSANVQAKSISVSTVGPALRPGKEVDNYHYHHRHHHHQTLVRRGSSQVSFEHSRSLGSHHPDIRNLGGDKEELRQYSRDNEFEFIQRERQSKETTEKDNKREN